MELSHSLVDAVWRPKFLLELDRGRLGDWLQRSTYLTEPLSWEVSPLNPKNRVDSLDTVGSSWRVDGSTICGTRFFAVPVSLLPDLPPLGIFVHVPDQTDFPPTLRSTLDAGASVPLRNGPDIASLAISQHICRALSHQCVKDPSILQRYPKLPFGSELIFGRVAPDPADMSLDVVPNYDFERKALSLDALRRLWADIPVHDWPEEFDVSLLRFVRQIHDTVCLVIAPESHSSKLLVFKSAIGSVDHTYHELRFLLTNPPHPHVMPRPVGIVTKRNAFGGKRGVVGFLLRYFPAGSLRDILPARQQAGTLSDRLKVKWCRQIVSAVIHIREEAATFVSDLRPDNVLLDEHEDVVLCDFEQRGNWHEWCAPEVLFRQYAENIRANLHPGEAASEAAAKYRRLLAGYAPPDLPETPVQAANRPWFLLNPSSQDKAAVYSLGLLIYTVFEGLSNVRRNIANQWPIDPNVEFPVVRHTPATVMDLVRLCTDEAVEWSDKRDKGQRARVVRRGDALYPEGQVDLARGTKSTAVAVLDTAYAWWSGELARAVAFLETDEWRSQQFGPNRPSLRDVLRALDELPEEL
ncbi:CBL-interacting serine/threonine-protein kinase 19 [Madurella mycetomatis]|uniref:CBL-interacting serine/threonine-protein kinase 19 n=1 Tax=Madurella mycetomatis TaxID=100816 RepID=A0A175W9V2_9PEZI|nr:CBL-interacting serine/threonine-protein kinase 19 [Madurella mycetomatis]KXX80375.1 CBL-interacting serine/threonine-protein kinase 19 [Madurella mycetomatis]